MDGHADDAIARRERVTSGPTASTTPENSPPGYGNCGWNWYLPRIMRLSGKLAPGRLDGDEHLVSFGKGGRNRLDGVRGGRAVRANEIRAVHGRAEAAAPKHSRRRPTTREVGCRAGRAPRRASAARRSSRTRTSSRRSQARSLGCAARSELQRWPTTSPPPRRRAATAGTPPQRHQRPTPQRRHRGRRGRRGRGVAARAKAQQAAPALDAAAISASVQSALAAATRGGAGDVARGGERAAAERVDGADADDGSSTRRAGCSTSTAR